MAYFSDLYSEIKPRLADWLEEEGGDVSDLSLDLLNRAQIGLWDYRPWTYLLLNLELSFDSDNSVTLPADFGKIIQLYHASGSDDKPDFYYYRDAEIDNGYTIRDTFAKATGHSFQLKLYQSASYTVTLIYQKTLTKFAGSGTEYSFFPGDLLLLEAQKIHIVESGLVGNEYNAIINRREDVLNDYTKAHHNVNADMRAILNDFSGENVNNQGYALDGTLDSLSSDTYSNDYDRG